VTEVKIDLESITCCACGLVFGVETKYKAVLRQTGKAFYCPNGCAQHYTENPLKAENERLGILVVDLQMRVDDLKKNIKERCPVCHQYFRHLDRHMKKNHGKEKP